MGMTKQGREPENNQVFILLSNQSLKLRSKRTKSRTKAAIRYSVSRVENRGEQNRRPTRRKGTERGLNQACQHHQSILSRNQIH